MSNNSTPVFATRPYADDVRDGYSTTLSQSQNERLVFLSETCLSLLHAIFKVQRHGYDGEDPMWGDKLPKNRTILISELGRLLFCANLLAVAGDVGDQDAKDITRATNEVIIQAKERRLPLYHQEQLIRLLRLDAIE